MPKATLTLKSGTTVTIEGTLTEVNRLLELHDEGRASAKTPNTEAPGKREDHDRAVSPDTVAEIVNLIRSCDAAERIEKQILDKSNVVNRCLLPLYIVHQELHNAFGLTTGQISAITKALGVPISQPNVAHTLADSAARFVMTSSTRKRGVAVDYRINRRGLQQIEITIKSQ